MADYSWTRKVRCRRAGGVSFGMPGQGLFALTILVFSLCGPVSGHARSVEEGEDGGNLEALERKLEMGRHENFVARLAQPDSGLSAFTTDGCSGGLSVGWEYLASRIETFHERLGESPSWESCCVTHDEAYHRGGPDQIDAEGSFEARKSADEALRACVIETGEQDAPELQARYDLSKEEVEFIYAGIAALMYRAVRIGGVPCTGLPWRWGYGWPECD